ncbi:hypothetical protein EWM64_g8092 [Hericium alpestre]|uniref:Alpha/beta hydrolase fold-3 domain-containing protein n=1 Tax=Hericium alpestre TaxID=135208 RepID=A0A4Y9ZNT4_9AGAM|nr:hypothetical protein EWM64_g8092 [Hericium alpestre]
MSTALTREAALRAGPLFLETLVRHYFERIKHDTKRSTKDVPLRQDELLYDEVFSIVKKFMQASTKHTVEELQAFSNTRIPAPPWVHIVRLTVPMSCCDEAAEVLIKAFGGSEIMKKYVGGVKWWQVRGVKGVDAEWITAKKDWQEAKRRTREEQERANPEAKLSKFRRSFKQSPKTPIKRDAKGHPTLTPIKAGDGKQKEEDAKQATPDSQEKAPAHEGSEDGGTYQPEMDEMRCILYSHGGGYYFGSVDQERYSIQRLARKIHGRVFAINYRLAPQYPFPCAIQDIIASYLYLIRPPPDAAHTPVKPSHIIIAGDSAGGGLSLAALQVIRESGLPAPGGAILISPWCDFTHSFPSIFTNTDTDVIPTTGLSLHKPSALWPAPSDELTENVRNRLRRTVREVIQPRLRRNHVSRSNPNLAASGSHLATPSPSSPELGHLFPDAHPSTVPKLIPSDEGPIPIGATAKLPSPGSLTEPVTLQPPMGEKLEIKQQLQLYAPNGLLRHPLVSPALSYLGGLPPMLVIASDKEVLRDEIIYAAHKAAHPDQYPVWDEAKKMYPALDGIEERYGPTPVHLQVYDDAAHILPVLFSFTSPARYCFRSMASFCKHVTNMSPTAQSPVSPVPVFTFSPEPASPTSEAEPGSSSPENGTLNTSLMLHALDVAQVSSVSSISSLSIRSDDSPLKHKGRPDAARRAWSTTVTRRTSTRGGSPPHAREEILAGDPAVYDGIWARSEAHQDMIRERVSTQGVIRPLEPAETLPALQVPTEIIGEINELAIMRYINGKTKFDKKFSSTIKRIEKHRQRNLKVASKDTLTHISRLQHYLEKESTGKKHTLSEGLGASTNWTLAWALDADEHPPPSSIVARRDTEEAIKLARIVDRAVLAGESSLNTNNLWSLVINFLTVTPDKEMGKHHHRHHRQEHEEGAEGAEGSEKRRKRDVFMPWLKRRKDAHTPDHGKEHSDFMSGAIDV